MAGGWRVADRSTRRRRIFRRIGGDGPAGVSTTAGLAKSVGQAVTRSVRTSDGPGTGRLGVLSPRECRGGHGAEPGHTARSSSVCTEGRRTRRLARPEAGPAGAVERKQIASRNPGCRRGCGGGGGVRRGPGTEAAYRRVEQGRDPGPRPGPGRVASVLRVGRRVGLGIGLGRAEGVAVQGLSDTGEGTGPPQRSKPGSGRKPARVGSGPVPACAP